MEAYQERVVEEQKQLEEKLSKLSIFINNTSIFKKLSQDEQYLLIEQERIMEEYVEILDKRIRLFK